MNPIVRFIRQREPNSTTVLLMKLQSTWEAGSHRALGTHDAPGSPGGQRMDPSRRSCGQDGLLAPGAWRERPRDRADQGPPAMGTFALWVGERQAGRRWASGLRQAGQGTRAYLNEPVSAFSVADCPGTAFRRAHTRTSSSRCAVSCRKGKDRLLPLCLHRKQAHPHRGNLQPPSSRWAGGRRRQRPRELEVGPDASAIPQAAQSPVTRGWLPRWHLYLVLSKA